MLLSKEIAVELNLAACKLKQYTASMLKKNKVGLTPEQFLVMDMLWNEGPMSQQKMADTIHKDKNSVTKLADALESKGLIIRKQDRRDRRSNTLFPTDKALKMKDASKEAGISILDGMLDGISEDDLRFMLQTLSRLTANMNG